MTWLQNQNSKFSSKWLYYQNHCSSKNCQVLLSGWNNTYTRRKNISAIHYDFLLCWGLNNPLVDMPKVYLKNLRANLKVTKKGLFMISWFYENIIKMSILFGRKDYSNLTCGKRTFKRLSKCGSNIVLPSVVAASKIIPRP